MKPSVELYNLIHSLSKSEKRFFKLTSTLQSGDKNYIKLFDFIESQKIYSEENVKKYFQNETFILHLPSEKNHLFKLILKSLRSYYSEQTLQNQLVQELKNIEILYNKALYKECEKFVLRAKSLAKESEAFYYWYELITWEKKLIEDAYDSSQMRMGLDILLQEEEVVVEKLRNLAEYQIIYSKINHVFRSGGFARSNQERDLVNQIADHHLIKSKNSALSSRASSICFFSQVINSYQ